MPNDRVPAENNTLDIDVNDDKFDSLNENEKRELQNATNEYEKSSDKTISMGSITDDINPLQNFISTTLKILDKTLLSCPVTGLIYTSSLVLSAIPL